MTTFDPRSALAGLTPAPTSLESAPAACSAPGCEAGWIEIPASETGDVPRMARCPECAERHRRAKQARALEEAGISGTIYAPDWSGIDLSHDSWQLARAYAREAEQLVTENLSLIFVGDYGRGKTQAATLILSAAAEVGRSVARVKWGQFTRRVRATYGQREGVSEDSLIAAIVAPDLVLLDDVGAADKHSEHNERLLTSVIDERYDAKRPTILTTNLGHDELQKHLGGRAYSRMWNNADTVVFDGPNYREARERPRARALAARIREQVRAQGVEAAD